MFFQRQKSPPENTLRLLESRAGAEPAIGALLRAITGFTAAESTWRRAQQGFYDQYEAVMAKGFAALQSIAAQEDFQRALLFASHSLLEQLPRFCQTPVADFTKKERRTGLAVLQYATRMSVKTSPLSRFTTVSVLPFSGEKSDGDLPAPVFVKAVLTPNVAILEALYAVLLREPVFYKSLAVSLNPCMVALPESRYQWLYFDGVDEGFQEMPADPVLNDLVELLLSKNHRLPYPEILRHLQDAVDAPAAELEQWLLNLTDHGFLEWVLPETGLSPAWCDNLYRYLGYLPAEPVIVQTAALLQWLRQPCRRSAKQANRFGTISGIFPWKYPPSRRSIFFTKM